jgi:hypothetical protein
MSELDNNVIDDVASEVTESQIEHDVAIESTEESVTPTDDSQAHVEETVASIEEPDKVDDDFVQANTEVVTPTQSQSYQTSPAPDNVVLLECIREERARLERDRISLAAAQEELKIRKREEIESTHLTKVSTFFWLHYLFNIPLIGFICSIVFAFAGTNITRKNYARARLIWHLISILCTVLLVLGVLLLIRFLSGNITDLFSEGLVSKIKDLL